MEVDTNTLNRILDGIDKTNDTIKTLSIDIAKINFKHEELPGKIETAIMIHTAKCKELKTNDTAKKIKLWKPIIIDFTKMVLTSVATIFGMKQLNQ